MVRIGYPDNRCYNPDCDKFATTTIKIEIGKDSITSKSCGSKECNEYLNNPEILQSILDWCKHNEMKGE